MRDNARNSGFYPLNDYFYCQYGLLLRFFAKQSVVFSMSIFLLEKSELIRFGKAIENSVTAKYLYYRL